MPVNPVSGVHFDETDVPQSYQDLYTNCGDPDAPDFAAKYLVSVTHHFADQGDVTFQCHKIMADPLQDAFDAIKAAGKLHLVKTFDGCHVNRDVRGSKSKSLHAWGLAIDINASQFPLGSHARQDHDVTVAFESHGFWYGGDYHHRLDPMHYQYAGDF